MLATTARPLARRNQADGVGDACDACPGTVGGAVVDEQGCPIPVPGDFDRDGDVDQSDFGHLQACFSGLGASELPPGCEDARLDVDGDVDLNDFAIFQACMSGASLPGDPGCGEPPL